MKIEIKLENSKCCNGCPKLKAEPIKGFAYYCDLGYFGNEAYNLSIKGIIRSERCIKENGE